METYLSIHIPKTAGTLFGRTLQGIVPELMYYYYGPTTPPSRLMERGQLVREYSSEKLKESFWKRSIAKIQESP